MTGKKGSGKKAKFITPPNVLRQKVGTGGIDQRLLERADEFIDNNSFDFAEVAEKIIHGLKRQLKEVKAADDRGKAAIDKLSRPIMELKASGGMFRYQMVSDVADIALNFLETVTELDDDCFEIVEAHHNALQAIVSKRLQGPGGAQGRALAGELQKASQRFFKKHGAKQ